jgi:glycosyltransferase involved in cell wall biosynthesis
VLIVAEHASARFGGEAILPLHYFRLLRSRGVPVWLISHARTRAELETLFPDHGGRLRFVRDTSAHRALWRFGSRLPHRVDLATSGYASHLLTQVLARRLARRLIAQHDIEVVHQPIPVSPKEPSLLYGLGVPVVIGPMNGGMHYPDAFAHHEGVATRALTGLARHAAGAAHRVLPGKLRAEVLLVANGRTRNALPRGTMGRVVELAENGVDLSLFRPRERSTTPGRVRLVFAGRLIRLKSVDVLLEAVAGAARRVDVELEIIGDGPERASLERLSRELGLERRVTFSGWKPQAEAAARVAVADALCMPSVCDCGGAVVLEAMACARPVIATAWGGPLDYIDEQTGILIRPTSRAALVAGFQRAIETLASAPALIASLGEAARRRAVQEFDWERKVDRMLGIYAEALARRPSFVEGRAS